MPKWIEFKKTFTQKQEDALWQYFIDHSQVQRNGYYMILFFVRGVDDFWKRVSSRANGDYKRYSIQEKEFRLERKMNSWARLRFKISANGNWLDKFLSWLNQKIYWHLYEKYGKNEFYPPRI